MHHTKQKLWKHTTFVTTSKASLTKSGLSPGWSLKRGTTVYAYTEQVCTHTQGRCARTHTAGVQAHTKWLYMCMYTNLFFEICTDKNTFETSLVFKFHYFDRQLQSKTVDLEQTRSKKQKMIRSKHTNTDMYICYLCIYIHGHICWIHSLDPFAGSTHWIHSLDLLTGSIRWILSLDILTGSIHWIYSLDLLTGSIHWILSLDPFAGSTHWIHSLDLLTGSTHWIHSLDLLTGSICWIHSLDLLTGSTHWILSLDLLTGSIRWIYSLDLLTGSTHWIYSLDLLANYSQTSP